jgi:hypothetical protein
MSLGCYWSAAIYVLLKRIHPHRPLRASEHMRPRPSDAHNYRFTSKKADGYADQFAMLPLLPVSGVILAGADLVWQAAAAPFFNFDRPRRRILRFACRSGSRSQSGFDAALPRLNEFFAGQRLIG